MLISEIKKDWQSLTLNNPYNIRGRIVFIRRLAKSGIVTIRDDSGDLEVLIDKAILDKELWQKAQNIEFGDVVSVNGFLRLHNGNLLLTPVAFDINKIENLDNPS